MAQFDSDLQFELQPVKPSTDKDKLNNEAVDLLKQIIAVNAADTDRVKDLTYLFNVSQTKKTMARLNAQSDLLDTLTQLITTRITEHPDNLSNQELFQGIKILQDAVEHSQKQITATTEPTQQPLIQINQQNNEINAGSTRSRESRENIQNAVKSILSGLGLNSQASTDSPIISTETEDA